MALFSYYNQYPSSQSVLIILFTLYLSCPAPYVDHTDSYTPTVNSTTPVYIAPEFGSSPDSLLHTVPHSYPRQHSMVLLGPLRPARYSLASLALILASPLLSSRLVSAQRKHHYL